MSNDFVIIFYWWFLLFGLGIIFLPLTWFFFRRFFDLGYPFSKIIAILLLSYFVWLAGSLHLLSFSVSTIWIVVLALVLGNIFLVRKFRKEIIEAVKSGWKILVFEEILFFLTLTFWSFIRGFQPDIEGLEKFMDFGFVNSLLRSEYFPPADMWMAGKTVNYYYFGHLVSAVLTKLTGLNPSITYNLMIATLFALAFTATLSLVANITNFSISKKFSASVFAGFLSALLLTLGGNLHTLWWFLTHNFSFTGYWYPDATRFIVEKFGAADNTIHEFPLYSFVVSDLHGHVSNIPFVLLFLSLLFAWLSNQGKTLITNYQLLITPLVLGTMYMTNSWDFPIYFLIFVLTIFYSYCSTYGFSIKSLFYIGLPARRSPCLAGRRVGAGGLVVLVFIGSILFSLPFHLNFTQIAKGLALVNAHSPYWQLLVLWGYQWIIMASFFIFLATKKFLITNYKLLITDVFILILLCVATVLIIIPEIFYVKDIYIPSYHRANTMFKLVYQSFVLYALASGYILVRILIQLQKRSLRFLLFTFYFLLFTFIFIYSYFAITSYYGVTNFAYYGLKTYRGLDGLSWLERQDPDDFAGIAWLKENVRGQPVVLEAAGDSYTDFNRVSMATGLPTIQGWLVHEWLWRGTFEEPGRRATEVETIYTTKDQVLTRNLLAKYRVGYVFIGAKEHEKYEVIEDKFRKLGAPVFTAGNTKIYQLGKLNIQ